MTPLLRIKRSVDKAWTELLAQVQLISNISQVRPGDAASVFRHEHQKAYQKVKTTIGPVSFNIPSKAKTPRPDLFITIKGWIEFPDDDEGGGLRSTRFSTEVAYFAEHTPNRLKHVFGIHYDYEWRGLIAHPIYHSQMTSMAEWYEHVNAAYGRVFQEPDNHLHGIIKHVRVPTAQMDAFSVFLQVCSDHLVNENTDAAGRLAYAAIMKCCGFFECSASSIPRLTPAISATSYRSYHWYV